MFSTVGTHLDSKSATTLFLPLTLSARLATSVDIYNKRDANVSFDLSNAVLFFASSE